MRRVQIRKVARLGTGHTPSRSVDAYWDPAECTIPWLTLADVWQLRDGSVSVIYETKERISPLGLANSAAVRHPAGTVAFSRTASVGFSCILGVDLATSQDFVTWTCGPKLDPRYLLWVLRAERDDILRRTQGSTHKTIYMPDIEQLTIPLPTLDEQRRIVEYLDAVTARIDDVVEKKRKMIRLLEERLAAYAFESTSAGPMVPIRRLVSTVRTGATPPAGSDLIADDGEIEWASPSDVGQRLALRPAKRRIRRPALAQVPIFPAGAVIVVGVGATAGRVAFADRAVTGNQQMTALVPNDRADPRFLAWGLFARSSHLLATAPYTTLPLLTNDFLRSVALHLPDKDAQFAAARSVDAAADQVGTAIQLLRQQVDRLQEHRQSLMAEAIVGEREAA